MAGRGGTRHNTRLTAAEEQDFLKWKQRYAAMDPGTDYDLRGAFKAGLRPDKTGHWPDTFKKPGHPTFSDESKYATRAYPGGHWQGEKYIPSRKPRPSAKGRR